MCTGRVDLSFVVRALSKGADGVFIGGCWLGECHYVTEGNYDSYFNTLLCRKLLEVIGITPERLRMEFIAASEGMRYAEVMNDFGRQLKALGPLGKGEGIAPEILKLKLEALSKLIPYIKLVERERLRSRFKTVEEYSEYFASETFSKLFQELLVDKLNISQVRLLLRDKPLPSAEIATTLGIEPADVNRYLKQATMQGLTRFDVDQKCFALA